MPSRLPMSRGFVRSVLPRVFDGCGGGGVCNLLKINHLAEFAHEDPVTSSAARLFSEGTYQKSTFQSQRPGGSLGQVTPGRIIRQESLHGPRKRWH